MPPIPPLSKKKTMRAVDIKDGSTNPVPAESLYINDKVPVPELKDGGEDVLVKVKAFGLNRMDIMQRQGKYPVPPTASKILGVEFSGTIEQISSSDDDGEFKVGDEVFGLAYGGAYAEHIAVSSKMLIHKPKEISWEVAAGIPEAWITAIQSLFIVGSFSPTKSESVLVHAGASSISIALIQLIRYHSPASKIFTTASTSSKLDFCTGTLGATRAFNYKDESVDWSEEIKKDTSGRGVDLIIDFVGQSHFARNLNAAGRDGRIVVLAMMSGSVVDGVDLAPILFKRLRIEGSTLRSRELSYQRVLRDKFVEEALEGIKIGKLKVFVERVFKWGDVVEAHKLMESNKTMGKIICTVD